VAVLAALAGRYEMVAGYLLWVMCSRLSHAAIAFRQGRRLSAYYVPLQVASDWATALTKLWVIFHPAKQNWLNRGNRKLNTTRGSSHYSLRTGFAHYLYGFSCAAVVVLIGLLVGFLPLLREARLFWNQRVEPTRVVPVNSFNFTNDMLALRSAPAPEPPKLAAVRGPAEALLVHPWVAMKPSSKDARRAPSSSTDRGAESLATP
jgi:hypothetical protein